MAQERLGLRDLTPASLTAFFVARNLATTNRYAGINIATKEAALRQYAPPPGVGGSKARVPVWRNDETMLAWLASL
jgi:hypothetical protein